MKEEKKRGWRRVIKEKDKFEKMCESEMKKWCERQKEDGEQDCEQIWQTWLETHNAITEEAVGRSKEKKKREWLKGELKREMSTKSGEERKKIVRQYTSFKNLVKRIINAKKKRKREEINEKLERLSRGLAPESSVFNRGQWGREVPGTGVLLVRHALSNEG